MPTMSQTATGERARSAMRSARGATEDPRAAETRARLCTAFERVVSQDGYGAATASRIAAEAGVSRSAFYDHFAGPPAVALAVVESLFEAIAVADHGARANGLRNRENARIANEAIATHMFEHPAMYRALLLPPAASGAVVVTLLEKFAAKALPAVRAARPESSARDASRAARVIAGAVLSTMIWWLQEDDPGVPSVLAEELVNLLPEWFTQPSAARHEPGA